MLVLFLACVLYMMCFFLTYLEKSSMCMLVVYHVCVNFVLSLLLDLVWILFGSFERLMDNTIFWVSDLLCALHNPKNVCSCCTPHSIDIVRLSSLLCGMYYS